MILPAIWLLGQNIEVTYKKQLWIAWKWFIILVSRFFIYLIFFHLYDGLHYYCRRKRHAWYKLFGLRIT